jgi:hypothetical protein
MERSLALQTCSGKLQPGADLQQVSTKLRRGAKPGDAVSVAPGSGSGEFSSGYGVTFGGMRATGQAPTGAGVGTGSSTGIGAMMGMTPAWMRGEHRLLPLVAELRCLLGL